MTDNGESIPEDLSLVHEIVTRILQAVKCPTNLRAFIDGLVSVSKGEFEFSISDAALADKIRTDAADIQQKSKGKWTQRQRTNLDTWQKQAGITLVEYESGSKDWVRNTVTETKYELFILAYATQVIRSIKENESLRSQNRHSAIEQAMHELANEWFANAKPPRERKKRIITAVQQIKLARTSLQNAKQLLEKYDAGIHGEDEDLLDEIEGLLTQLRERVGYYGEWVRLDPDDEG